MIKTNIIDSCRRQALLCFPNRSEELRSSSSNWLIPPNQVRSSDQVKLLRECCTSKLTLHHRPVATQKITDADAYQILVSQRRHRPTSPHLTIYRPQITWYASITHRITGSILSGGVYCFGAAYLVAPLFGWHLESATLAAAFGAWPVAAKVATKFFIAWPFTFHCLNGVRHLVWDTGAQFANKQVNATGWTVVGLSTVSALGLATLY